MADIVFNVAKGRVNELLRRVDVNDPANSTIVVVPVDVAAVTDATLRDLTTLSAILGAGVTERSTSGWNRKVLTDADVTAPSPDNTNDRQDADLPDLTWTSVSAGAVTDLIVCWDPDSTSGADADLVPLTLHDFVVTPTGTDVTATIAGFFRAS